MQNAATREIVQGKALRLPPCLIPRPGDRVVWFQHGNSWHGKFLGIADSGRAVVERPTGYSADDVELASIRVADRRRAVKPMWSTLRSGLICRPTDHEKAALAPLGNQQVSRDLPSTRELAEEIWERGFEVFFTGESVRRALTQEQVIDSELITTMPNSWLGPLLTDMYVRDRESGPRFDSLRDRFLLGEIVGNPGAYAYIRLFRSPYLDDRRIYRASFADENGFNGLTLNSIYFDPKNDVLIDPTGEGLTDVGERCLRPVYWTAGMPQVAMCQIGLMILRNFLEGCTFCPGMEGSLLKFVQALGRAGDLAAALHGEVFKGRPDIDSDSEKIEKLLQEHGMGDLWLSTFQPAILDMKGSNPNGGRP